MTDTLAAILAVKGSTVHCVEPESSVLQAVRMMNQEKIGAVLVCSRRGAPVGIFTERDVLCRVVDQSRDPYITRVRQVMTTELVTVKPSTTIEQAMAVVSERRCRHLPVMEDGTLHGLVSIGDLTRWVSRHREIRIQDLVNYITNRYPA